MGASWARQRRRRALLAQIPVFASAAVHAARFGRVLAARAQIAPAPLQRGRTWCTRDRLDGASRASVPGWARLTVLLQRQVGAIREGALFAWQGHRGSSGAEVTARQSRRCSLHESLKFQCQTHATRGATSLPGDPSEALRPRQSWSEADRCCGQLSPMTLCLLRRLGQFSSTEAEQGR